MSFQWKKSVLNNKRFLIYFLEVVSKSVLRGIRKENLSSKDLDMDPVIDVVKKAAAEESSSKFINLSVYPFRCSLISVRQIQMCLDYAKKHKGQLLRAHFDATGSIFRKIGTATCVI